MSSRNSSHFRRALWLAFFLFSLLGTGQNAKAQWWKDTVWTKKTDQQLLSNLKFSNADSIIAGGGLFFDAKTGNEIWRISTSNEFFFLENDKSFIKLNNDGKTFEIYDMKTHKVIDSLEHDSIEALKYGDQTISKDLQYIAVKLKMVCEFGILRPKKSNGQKYFQMKSISMK